MTESRKVFYEIKKPPRKHYAVIVRELSQSQTECQFNEPLYNKEHNLLGSIICREDWSDITTCTCCGTPVCGDHLSTNEDLCITCAKLAPGDIEKIQTLRKELNG